MFAPPCSECRYTLVALQLLVGVGATAAGAAFIADPSGAGLGMHTAMLRDGPFPDYLVPGLVLFTVNGLGSLAGALLSWGRHPAAGRMAQALGLFLVAWIAVQVAVIGPSSWLQPAFLLVGLAELGLGHLLGRAASPAPRTPLESR